MPDASKFSGISKEDMNKMAKDKTKAGKSDSGETQKDTSSKEDKPKAEEQNQSSQNQQNSPEPKADATDDVQQELVDYVKNTFGVPEDQIDETHLKIAKSAKESQREFNRFYNSEFQPIKKKAEAFDNYDSFLQQNPDLYQQIEARANGKENPSQSESHKANSNSQGKLEDVDEKTLIQEGYVDKAQLDSADELARERMLARAEVKYLNEQGVKEYQSKLRETYEQEQQRIEKERKQEQAKRKYNQSFDSFLDQYPEVDFSKPEFNKHLDKINEMTARLIDVEDDPFKVSAELVLGRDGKLPQKNQTQQNPNIDQKLDSGVNMNKTRSRKGQQNEDALDRQVKQRRAALNNVRKSRKFETN